MGLGWKEYEKMLDEKEKNPGSFKADIDPDRFTPIKLCVFVSGGVVQGVLCDYPEKVDVQVVLIEDAEGAIDDCRGKQFQDGEMVSDWKHEVEDQSDSWVA